LTHTSSKTTGADYAGNGMHSTAHYINIIHTSSLTIFSKKAC